jgi:integrase/recombinase XerD
MIAKSFPGLLQAFFTERLFRQRRASGHTIAGYRDTFRLLLRYAAERLRTTPSKLRLAELAAPFIGQFLEHLEQERGNSARTRNALLAAIHSFFQHVALEEPAHALLCQRVLAMPNKRHERRQIEFLHREEIAALIAAPDPATWIGRRDQPF